MFSVEFDFVADLPWPFLKTKFGHKNLTLNLGQVQMELLRELDTEKISEPVKIPAIIKPFCDLGKAINQLANDGNIPLFESDPPLEKLNEIMVGCFNLSSWGTENSEKKARSSVALSTFIASYFHIGLKKRPALIDLVKDHYDKELSFDEFDTKDYFFWSEQERHRRSCCRKFMTYFNTLKSCRNILNKNLALKKDTPLAFNRSLLVTKATERLLDMGR